MNKRLEKSNKSKRDLLSEFESEAKVAKIDEPDIEWYKGYTSDLEGDNFAKLCEKVHSLKDEVESLMTQVDELTGALNDAQQKTIEFYSSEKREFKPLIHNCVWNLLSMHVSFVKISKVVVTVLKMCGMNDVR